ncbi:hypothetical protein PV433_33890 [Paenibacillus sp. GYB004]|uniref:hypothetical protein n=1 Tax=Paenibacillus sp. GYB004 TaxID=2994393 RepID=UPI002F965847
MRHRARPNSPSIKQRLLGDGFLVWCGAYGEVDVEDVPEVPEVLEVLDESPTAVYILLAKQQL